VHCTWSTVSLFAYLRLSSWIIGCLMTTTPDNPDKDKLEKLSKALADVYGVSHSINNKDFRFPLHGVDKDFPENGVARLTITTKHRKSNEIIVKSMDLGSVCDAVSMFNIMKYANPDLVEYSPDTNVMPSLDKIYVRISTMGGRVLHSPNLPDSTLLQIDSVNGYSPLKLPKRCNYKLLAFYGDSSIVMAEADDLESMMYGIKQEELKLSAIRKTAVKFVESTQYSEIVGNKYVAIVKYAIYDSRGHQVKLSELKPRDPGLDFGGAYFDDNSDEEDDDGDSTPSGKA